MFLVVKYAFLETKKKYFFKDIFCKVFCFGCIAECMLWDYLAYILEFCVNAQQLSDEHTPGLRLLLWPMSNYLLFFKHSVIPPQIHN